MSIIEKSLYKGIAEDLMLYDPCDDYIWGEDLYDLTILVYSGSIRDISCYELVKEDLLVCGLFYYDRKKDCLKMEKIRIHEPTGDIYISERAFNPIWPALRESIQIGIDQAPDDAENVAETPEDTVFLKLNAKKNQRAVITPKGIKYKIDQPSVEVNRLRSRRQSMMDNKDLIFCFSKQGGYVHDKCCPIVSLISDEDFMASATMPEGSDKCHSCRMMMAVREACKPRPKQIQAICGLFSRTGVGTRQIEKLVFDKGYRFFLNTPNELSVETREDKWFIRIHSNQKLSLWHNNYTKISDTERTIGEGFHKQGDFGKSIKNVLKYIDQYSWEKFHVEKAETVDEKAVAKDVHIETSMEKEFCFRRWLRNLWEKLTTLFRWNEKTV